MIKKNILLTILLFVFEIAPTRASVLPAGMTILSSNEQGVTISYSIPNWHRHDHLINNVRYQSFNFDHTEIAGAPGEPQLPVITTIIGIPLSGEVKLNVIDSAWEDERAHLAPVPHISQSGDWVRYDYCQDSTIYSSAEPFPSEIVRMEAPGFFRDQRIVRLHFFPLQYLPALGVIRKYQQILIQLQFTASGRATITPVISQKKEHLYRQLIANYDQARSWRLVHDRKFAKTGSGFDGNLLYKIRINKEGCYKITGKILADNGVSLAEINPSTIKIYNNGGLELPVNVAETRPDGPVENAILVVAGNDNSFDLHDYILFYGQPLTGWRYNPSDDQYYHYLNHYNIDNIYILTFGTQPGKRMEKVSSLSIDDLKPETFYLDHYFLEEELFNPLQSGMDWVGRLFHSDRSEQIYQVNLAQVNLDGPANFKSCFGILGPSGHRFAISVNNHLVGTTNFYGAKDYLYFRQKHLLIQGLLKEGTNEIKIDYTPGNVVVRAFLDWIEISYARKFLAENNFIAFNKPIKNGAVRYHITGFTNDVQVFDVTDYARVRQIINFPTTNGSVMFADSASSRTPGRYVVVAPAAIRAIDNIEKIEAADIRTPRSAEFIIITHDDFLQQAFELKSLHEDWRRMNRLRTEVVNVKDIYLEFSCGLLDPTAIRDFIKYAFENWTDDNSATLAEVLFFGDGDYDFKNYSYILDKNWLPPFEKSDEYIYNTLTTDDWFVDINGNNIPDIAVGRLPVQTPADAANVVEKIIQYETRPEPGEWCANITIVADDQNGEDDYTENFHTTQMETLSSRYIPKEFEQNKVYLINYKGENSPVYSRPVKPEANKDLLAKLNAGTLIFDFIGHGATTLLTHERVLNQPADLNRIQNAGKLPLWVTATCDFGLWDNPEKQSFSEELLNVNDRGAIAVIGPTRKAFSPNNAEFNYLLFESMFQNYETGREVETLGNALVYAKAKQYGAINAQKYALLGLPTMRLAAPKFKILIDSVHPDTIMALRKLTVHGKILTGDQCWNDYQGKVLLKVFDSEKDRQFNYQVNGNDYKINYKMPGNTIFRGYSSIENGQFEVKFIVPKDISYGGSKGRVSAYAWNDDMLDANGYYENLPVGGTAKNLVDHEGPEIKIGFDGQAFINGDYVNKDPVLKVEISDTVSGVNITGAIGHQIEMTLDRDASQKTNLNDYFRYYQGNCYRGELLYSLNDLNHGEHTVAIKAWDNANNASSASVQFILISGQDFAIHNMLNYPNPMTNSTHFTFELVGIDAEVSLMIYTVSGQLVRSFPGYQLENIGFNIFPETWDGTDQDGDPLANGLYIYRMTARTTTVNGEADCAEAIGKLIIAR